MIPNIFTFEVNYVQNKSLLPSEFAWNFFAQKILNILF